MADPIIQPGKEAGEFVIPALGKTIKLVEWREGVYYDTVEVTETTPTAGLEFDFFRDLERKSLQHTNLKTQRNIPAGTEFIMTKIGIVPNQALGNILPTDADIIRLAYSASLTFKINDRLIEEGPLLRFQSGYGVTGSTTRNATGVVTIGVPSGAAAPTLLVAQNVKERDALEGKLMFKDNAWLEAGSSMPTFTVNLGVTLMLGGLIKKPQGQ